MRSTTAMSIAAGVALLSATSLATAADDPTVVGSPIQGILPAIMAVVVFGVAMLILCTQIWPRITKALDQRNDKIREEIAAAEEARRQAREALKEYEENLAQARAEAQQMLDNAKQQQQQLAAELRAKADAELQQMRDRATRDIDAAKRAALSEIYAQTSTLATEVARKILSRDVSADDQERLVQESIQELQSISSN